MDVVQAVHSAPVVYAMHIFSYFPQSWSTGMALIINIPCIHIPYALWSYVLFAQLSVYSPVYLPSGFVSPLFIQCASMCGTVASANCLATGFSWGRSQWGNLPFADSKIALMCILSPFHVTPMPLITYGTFSLSSRYTMYVPYHIPILKYNVFRFPEVHQRAPLLLA